MEETAPHAVPPVALKPFHRPNRSDRERVAACQKTRTLPAPRCPHAILTLPRPKAPSPGPASAARSAPPSRSTVSTATPQGMQCRPPERRTMTQVHRKTHRVGFMGRMRPESAITPKLSTILSCRQHLSSIWSAGVFQLTSEPKRTSPTFCCVVHAPVSAPLTEAEA